VAALNACQITLCSKFEKYNEDFILFLVMLSSKGFQNNAKEKIATKEKNNLQASPFFISVARRKMGGG
jgi:hypothetical protein